MDLSTLPGLLAALTFPVFLINYIVTNYLDNQKWWTDLAPGRKSLYEIVSAIIISVAAYAGLQLLPFIPASWTSQINAIYPLLFAIFSAWVSGQIGHQIFIRGQVRSARIKMEISVYALQEAELSRPGATLPADLKVLLAKG